MDVPFRINPPSDAVGQKMAEEGVSEENYSAWVNHAGLAVAGGTVGMGVQAGAMFLGGNLSLSAIASVGPALNMLALVGAQGGVDGVLVVTIIDVVFSAAKRAMLLHSHKPPKNGLH